MYDNVMNGLIALIETDDTIKGIELPYNSGAVKIVAFADDSTFFVGDKDDPSKYHSHLGVFRKASFLRCNDDKTLIMGLQGALVFITPCLFSLARMDICQTG